MRGTMRRVGGRCVRRETWRTAASKPRLHGLSRNAAADALVDHCLAWIVCAAAELVANVRTQPPPMPPSVTELAGLPRDLCRDDRRSVATPVIEGVRGPECAQDSGRLLGRRAAAGYRDLSVRWKHLSRRLRSLDLDCQHGGVANVAPRPHPYIDIPSPLSGRPVRY